MDKNRVERPCIIRRPEVEARLGISRSTLYSYLDERSNYFKPNFPKPVKLGRNVGFVEHEIDQFLMQLMQERCK